MEATGTFGAALLVSWDYIRPSIHLSGCMVSWLCLCPIRLLRSAAMGVRVCLRPTVSKYTGLVNAASTVYEPLSSNVFVLATREMNKPGGGTSKQRPKATRAEQPETLNIISTD